MNILAPINSINDVVPVITAGATELFCGIIPKQWSKVYGSTVSPNRREWKSANIATYSQLNDIVELAHQNNARVFLTLNSLYINSQNSFIDEMIKEAVKCNVDAFIVADIGIIIKLKSMNLKQEIHISTGGTAFNSETAKFYETLDIQRITLPRHVQPSEAKKIVKSTKNIQYEAFVLNSGCKNIDGYCTFLHGLKEHNDIFIWKFLKKLNFDRFILKTLQILPTKFTKTLNFSCFNVDSPCLMKYNFDIITKDSKLEINILHENLKSFFSLLSGADPCGACRIKDFYQSGIHSLKIVGRNYATKKKTTDILFIKDIINNLNEQVDENDADFKKYVKKQYQYYYKVKCKNLCYYPD